MEFLNKIILSEKYGIGTIISVDDSVFTIEFKNETRSFNYMIAFKNKALSFVNENDQKELDDLFAEKEAERVAAEKKAAEIKELTTEEIVERIGVEEREYQDMKLNHVVSPLDKPSSLTDKRRTIARLKTMLAERQMSNQDTNK